MARLRLVSIGSRAAEGLLCFQEIGFETSGDQNLLNAGPSCGSQRYPPCKEQVKYRWWVEIFRPHGVGPLVLVGTNCGRPLIS